MRPRKTQRHLPRCVYHRHGAYYYVERGKWEPLGKDLVSALAEYARRFSEPLEGRLDKSIDEAFEYIKRRPAVNGKPISPSTVSQYEVCVKKLKRMLRHFATPTEIKQRDVARVKMLLAPTPNMANRVLSVFRLMCEYWLEQQLIESNPAIGVRRHAEKKRTRLIRADEFTAIYEKAPPRLQVMLDLWRLTGQRVVDVIRIRRADLREDGIYFQQDKTAAQLIVRWNPELKTVVERAKSLYGNVRALTLFHTRRGTVPSYKTVYGHGSAPSGPRASKTCRCATCAQWLARP